MALRKDQISAQDAPHAGAFCPKYHPIHSSYLFDPSGALLDENGLWHLWEDEGSWSHWTSRDLIHWSGALVNGTGFSQDTGAVSPTPSGAYALWPIMGGTNNADIASAKAKTPISCHDGCRTHLAKDACIMP